MSKRPDRVIQYINQGGDIHAENDALLRSATWAGLTSLVKFLLEHGANVHAGADYTTNPDVALITASEKGYTDIVKLLLEYGANVHTGQDEPLREASSKRHLNVVKLLLQYGAKPDRIADQFYGSLNPEQYVSEGYKFSPAAALLGLRYKSYSAEKYRERVNLYMNALNRYFVRDLSLAILEYW